MSEKALRRAIAAHLDTKHSTLWLDWDISSADRREVALDEMTKEIAAILQHVDHHTKVGQIKLSPVVKTWHPSKGPQP